MSIYYDEIDYNYNKREQIILGTILNYQYENSNGIRHGKLWLLIQKTEKMPYSSFNRILSKLVKEKDSIIEKEVIGNKKGKPTLYRIKKDIFFGILEKNEIIYELLIKKEVDSFIDDIQNLDTNAYVNAVMEFLFGHITLLGIVAMLYENKKVRDISYYAVFDNIVRLIDSIADKGKSKEEKEKIFESLFEVLKPFSERGIGKKVSLDKIYEGWKDIKSTINSSK